MWQTLKKVAGSSNFRARLTSYGLVATAWSLAIISAKPIILSARYRVIEQKNLYNILYDILNVFFFLFSILRETTEQVFVELTGILGIFQIAQIRQVYGMRPGVKK